MKYHFRTNRLSVRLYKKSDFQIWKNSYLQLSDPKNRWDQKLRNAGEFTKQNFNKIIKAQDENIAQDSFIDFIAFDKKEENIIGTVSIMDISRGVFQNAYLGYRIFNPYWRKGYGKELIDKTIDFSFKKLKLHRLEAGIHPQNKRSIALAKSLGLRKEGYSKRRLYLDGQWQDMVLYAITSEERSINHNTGKLRRNRR